MTHGSIRRRQETRQQGLIANLMSPHALLHSPQDERALVARTEGVGGDLRCGVICGPTHLMLTAVTFPESATLVPVEITSRTAPANG